MDKRTFHKMVWRIIQPPVCGFFRRKLGFTPQKHHLNGPTLVISNHVTNFDPLLVAGSFPRNQMYFVASEHLFRKGFASKAINFLVAPIARRKGASGADTAMAMLRKLRSGSHVCIFGEGENTWNGVTQPIFPGTGNIAKLAKASLATYRLEGGYFTCPRWGKGVRKGEMQGGIVNLYTPDMLQNMSLQEIEDAVARDLYENAWERQKQHPIAYRGKDRAKHMETALFLCPKCYQYGTLHGEGNHIQCTCGLDLEYTEEGKFSPAQPFESILAWDEWQMECLAAEPTPPPLSG